MAVLTESSNSECAYYNGTIFDYNDVYLLMAWVNLLKVDSYGTIIMVSANAANHDAAHVDSFSGNLRMEAITNGSGGGSGAAAATGWHHVAISRQDVSFCDIFVDGVKTGSGFSVVIGRTAATYLTFGATRGDSAFSDFGGGWHFAAAKCWTGLAALNVDIQEEMRTYAPCRWKGLWGAWPMYSGVDRLKDFSGNSRDLTASGTLSDETGPGVADIDIEQIPISVPDAVVVGSDSMVASMTSRRSRKRLVRM